jgi:hypothetical protein
MLRMPLTMNTIKTLKTIKRKHDRYIPQALKPVYWDLCFKGLGEVNTFFHGIVGNKHDEDTTFSMFVPYSCPTVNVLQIIIALYSKLSWDDRWADLCKLEEVRHSNDRGRLKRADTIDDYLGSLDEIEEEELDRLEGIRDTTNMYKFTKTFGQEELIMGYVAQPLPTIESCDPSLLESEGMYGIPDLTEKAIEALHNQLQGCIESNAAHRLKSGKGLLVAV